MAYCGRCGTQLSDGMNFCPKCGNSCNDESCQSAENNFNKQKNLSRISTKSFLLFCLIIAIIGCGWIVWNKQSSKYSLERLAEILPNYDYFDSFHEGIAIGHKGDKHGYFNMQGKVITPCIYGEAYPFTEGFACVKKDGKWGFIDYSGKEIIPCQYDYATNFSEGLALVEKDGKYGFIDNEGKVVIPFKLRYGYSTNFSEGLAAIATESGGYQYIDKTGKVILTRNYDDGPYPDFHNGLAPKMDKVSGNYGYIDKTGKMVIPAAYFPYGGSFGEFKDGYSIVMKADNMKEEVIDVNGRNVLGFDVDYAKYNDEVIMVCLNDEYTFYNTKGEKIIEKIFKGADVFSEGLAPVTTDGECWGYVDKNGNEVIPCIYEVAYPFSEGLARVQIEGVNGIIDKKGNSTFDINAEHVGLMKKKDMVKDNEENVQEEEIKQEGGIRQEENENTAVQQDYNNKIMSHVSAIQQIMNEINSIHNRCVAVLNQNPNQAIGVNAVADISDLTIEGDRHFRQMISLAREMGKQEDINTIRQEMDDFDYKSNQMKQNILRLNDNMY